MSKKKNEVVVTPFFARRLKPLLKKFKSLNTELDVLKAELVLNPQKGTALGNGMYKIRLASQSKGKGKSGGFRIITYLLEYDDDKETYEVNLITIFDKSDESSIDKPVLLEMVKKILG